MLMMRYFSPFKLITLRLAFLFSEGLVESVRGSEGEAFNSAALLTKGADVRYISLMTTPEFAEQTPELSEVAKAFQRTELKFKLEQSRHTTVFLPTNEALVTADVDLETLPYGQVREILFHNVLPEVVKLSEIDPGEQFNVTSMAGSSLVITGPRIEPPAEDTTTENSSKSLRRRRRSTPPAIEVNGVRLDPSFVDTANGIVYITDELLLPPGMSPASLLESSPFLLNTPQHILDTNEAHRRWGVSATVDPPFKEETPAAYSWPSFDGRAVDITGVLFSPPEEEQAEEDENFLPTKNYEITINDDDTNGNEYPLSTVVSYPSEQFIITAPQDSPSMVPSVSLSSPHPPYTAEKEAKDKDKEKKFSARKDSNAQQRTGGIKTRGGRLAPTGRREEGSLLENFHQKRLSSPLGLKSRSSSNLKFLGDAKDNLKGRSSSGGKPNLKWVPVNINAGEQLTTISETEEENGLFVG